MIWKKQVVLGALLAFASMQSALACGICIEKPEESLASLLLRADAVVIAREDPVRPYRFEPVKVLSGTPEGPDIPFLVDSSTKRRLARHTSDGVLMLREGQEWIRAGFADAAWRETASTILAHGPEWQVDPDARFAFFESLLHETDPFLRHIAVDELSRASFGLLRRMQRPIEGHEARRALVDRSEYPWQSFYILMLGHSNRAADHDLVRERMAAAARTGGRRQLNAWATAFVEIEGADGVTHLVKAWFDVPDRSAVALRAIISAMSLQARHGAPGIKEPVLKALSELPGRRPDVAGSVATALGKIGDFSHAEAIERTMASLTREQALDIDGAELFAVSSYAYQSRNAGGVNLDPLLKDGE